MTANEFERVRSLIHSAFPNVAFVRDNETAKVFFNILNRYEYQDVWRGVKDLVEVERYDPKIADVVRYVEDAERQRKDALRRMSSAELPRYTVRCTKCNDAGFMWVTYKGGTEAARICDCEAAREKNPWAFLSDEAYEEARQQKIKRGEKPPVGKPGHDTSWWVENCGEVVSVTPGQRVPAPPMVRA